VVSLQAPVRSHVLIVLDEMHGSICSALGT
jgi:hypothetical protein